jgi:DNA polymerase III subunit gamma/tau
MQRVSALYRTHRPLDFSQVVGQGHVVRTLSNAIDQDRVAHAYLFAGPRGTGKTSMAKILAKSLNCEQGPTTTPCLVCESCRTIHDATAIDVIEMDAASHRGIDDIREIRDKVVLRPVLGRYKIYIVDEAHMLTKEASNAVLKTLEEPPDHAIFVLCTTEMQAMLPTIRSRCQRFAFHRPTHAETSELLQRIAKAEGIEIDDAAIAMVARAGGGSFRDAVSLLDQLQTACSQRITADDARALLGTADEEMLFRALDLVAAGDAAGSLQLVDELAESGADLGSVTTGLLAHLRGLFLTQQLGAPPPDLALTTEEQARLAEQAGRLTPTAVVRLIDLLREVVDEVKEGSDPRLPLELALVKVCRPQGELSLEALQQRVERLEGGAPAPPPAAAAAPAPPAAPAEPAAQASPEPPSPPPASGDGLVSRWEDAVLPEVGRRSPPLRALLDHARPTGIDDGVFSIAFVFSLVR